MGDELLPCPFCGAPAALEEVAGTGQGWLAVCTRDPGCGTRIEMEKRDAAARWNNRAGLIPIAPLRNEDFVSAWRTKEPNSASDAPQD